MGMATHQNERGRELDTVPVGRLKSQATEHARDTSVGASNLGNGNDECGNTHGEPVLKPSASVISRKIVKLRKQAVSNRLAHVKAEIQANQVALRQYTAHLEEFFKARAKLHANASTAEEAKGTVTTNGASGSPYGTSQGLAFRSQHGLDCQPSRPNAASDQQEGGQGASGEGPAQPPLSSLNGRSGQVDGTAAGGGTTMGGGTGVGNDNSQDQRAPVVISAMVGGKTAVRPVKLPAVENVPPYMTWIYLDRNMKMTEDQSVAGRRRLYYDAEGDETIPCSDSEEDGADIDDEDCVKKDFGKTDDFVIIRTITDHGCGPEVLEELAKTFDADPDDIEARYEFLKALEEKEASRSNPTGKKGDGTDNGSEGDGVVIDRDEPFEAEDLKAAMDSFDNLLCRRCLVFDCRLHGCNQIYHHPVLCLTPSACALDLGSNEYLVPEG
ncbi:hypothetical protein CBR_g8474 [Chara braunii]|uniref:Histone-lysine N-methyltransferase CLF-like HTH domain-containing protein n=1 Tax=Chara braunii TaxID=69332 RepID=A0A388KMA3_CHABU|nr:hypothetical protein CBR_g8474 [Chara braunii]|eukprot:GBG71172.1 hypothetical protein CBR_g8474 [Chara braunii]